MMLDTPFIELVVVPNITDPVERLPFAITESMFWLPPDGAYEADTTKSDIKACDADTAVADAIACVAKSALDDDIALWARLDDAA